MKETRTARAKENDLCLGGATISRHHAILRCEGDALQVEDLGSRCGTFVDGVRMDGTVRVAQGGRIRIGTYEL